MAKENHELVDFTGRVCNILKKREEITPDFHILKRYLRIPLFVYGNCKSNGTASYILKNCPSLGAAHTITSGFCMKKTEYDAVVFERDPKGNEPHFYVRGEMRIVNPEVILTLDQWYQKKFIRSATKFCLEDISYTQFKSFRGLNYVDGFIYIGNPEYWTDTAKLHNIPSRRYGHIDRIKDMDFQYYDITTKKDNIRTPSAHKGVTDMFDDLDDKMHKNNPEMQRLEHEYSYGGI